MKKAYQEGLISVDKMKVKIAFAFLTFLIGLWQIYSIFRWKSIEFQSITQRKLLQSIKKIISDHENGQLKKEDLEKFKEILGHNDKKSSCQSELVCNEVYLGNLADLPWHENAWILSPNCTKKNVENLISILLQFNEHTEKIIENLIKQYGQNLKILVGLDKDQLRPNLNGVSIVQSHSENIWQHLISQAKTPYVLIGYKLRPFMENWGNLERLIRVIGDGNFIGASTGATKNSSGHWRSHCWQANLKGYSLILGKGYHQSACDCQICSILWNNFGPFVALTSDLVEFSSFSNPSLAFLDFFLYLDSRGKKVASCPDILFNTGPDLKSPPKEKWKNLLIKWGLMGVSLDLGPEKVLQFPCHQLGLSCNPAQQTQNSIVPWCCMHAANHILKAMNLISDQLGLHYEVDSGTLLGAVKLNNFIPWDIDGDIYIRTEDMHHFHRTSQ